MQQKQADTRRSTDSKTDASSKTLLVTVGSTLFPSLTDIILSAPILEVIASSGTTKLAVQYGRADLPSASRFREGGGFEVDLDLTGKGASTFVTMGGPSESFNEDDRRRRELKVEVFRFTDDFEGLIRSSDYVISHAGSGSILTTLRTVNRTTGNPIPLLVVPNESLMDNHQAELADKMGEEGYLFVSRVE
ncbi:hypothetical protein I317_05573 [Kwoniella heveanensis CBS 569]|nr:hypothetical protein I317_05573 [Kwoniella heveanensis CBS 569]